MPIRLRITPATAALHTGDYSVEVVVDGCTVTSDPFAVAVYAPATAAPTATSGTICFGESLALFANATNAVSYAWSGPNGFASTAQDPTIDGATPAANGTYTLDVTSVEGCVSQAAVT